MQIEDELKTSYNKNEQKYIYIWSTHREKQNQIFGIGNENGIKIAPLRKHYTHIPTTTTTSHQKKNDERKKKQQITIYMKIVYTYRQNGGNGSSLSAKRLYTQHTDREKKIENVAFAVACFI